MKFNYLFQFILIISLILTVSCGGNDKNSNESSRPKASTGNSRPKTDVDSLSYAIGVDQGSSLKVFMQRSNVELSEDMLIAGIITALNDDPDIFIKPQEARTVVNEYFEKREIQKKTENLEAGRKFLAENAKKAGIETTASGLQYRIEREGSGKNPMSYDTVEVHYRGTLINGNEFESSYNRNNKPVKFALDGVIKGWTEGIQLMKEGAKYTFFIPTELAYGENTYPGSPIEANVPLIFEVELLKVIPGEETKLKKAGND